MAITRIVSGSQSGVDRAALDAALAAGIACGGWCPRGRRAEDGRIPACYPLTETEGSGYRERTRLNVRDSDATLVLTRGPVEGGTAYTLRCADALGRPVFLLRLDGDVDDPVAAILGWAAAKAVSVLNIAGPREGERPGIGAVARQLLDRLCAALHGPA
jgi:hypothetical protein